MKEISWLNHEALGADALGMVVWRGMNLTLIGVASGLAASLALTRIISTLRDGEMVSRVGI
jgi:hypothetical protein